jgi:hypothetical protein
MPTFADTGRHLISVTNPYGHILGFLDLNSFIESYIIEICCFNPKGHAESNEAGW